MLPPLPDHYQNQAYKFLVDSFPFKWFHQLETEQSPLFPYLRGMAFALAYLRYAQEQGLNASIPMLSDGIWLTLHLKGIGLQRTQGESTEEARDRYQWEFRPTRNTRMGELAALEKFLGLSPPQIRIETDRRLGRFGQFRLILDDSTLPWNEVDTSFIGPFINKYVSNGIIPSVDIGLQCLILDQLPYFRFSDQFAMGHNQLRPFWMTPSFYSPLRLNFARSLIAQVTATEWRSDRDRLLELHKSSIGQSPGTVFVYLSDKDPCPYLRAEIPVPALESEGLTQQSFQFDGFKHSNQFPRIGESVAFSLDAPALNSGVQAIVVSPALEIVDVPDQLTLNDFSNLATGLIVLHYYGVSFTRYKVTKINLNTDALTPSAPDLIAMSEGLWTLALTEGDPTWGNFPPSGSTRNAAPFAELKPRGLYWSNSAGDRRSSFPAVEENGDVYLAIEFMYPSQGDRTIREIELRLTHEDYSGQVPHYRRVAFPVDEKVNAGFLFLVRGYEPEE